MRNWLLRAGLLTYLLFGPNLAAPSHAVNFEFGAGGADEHLGLITRAAVFGPDGGPFSSTNGAVALEIADAESFAGYDDSGNPGIEAFTGASAVIYTNMALDSPAALVGTDPLEATGTVTQAGISYDSSLDVLSVFDSFDEESPAAVDWVIDVLPSAGQPVGALTRVHIEAAVNGTLSSTGNSTANVSWLVAVNETTNLIIGSAGVHDTSLPFSAMGSYDFVIPLGSSFDLRFHWAASVSGSDLADSNARFSHARIDMSAAIIPEPSALLLFALGMFGLRVAIRRASRSVGGA